MVEKLSFQLLASRVPKSSPSNSHYQGILPAEPSLDQGRPSYCQDNGMCHQEKNGDLPGVTFRMFGKPKATISLLDDTQRLNQDAF